MVCLSATIVPFLLCSISHSLRVDWLYEGLPLLYSLNVSVQPRVSPGFRLLLPPVVLSFSWLTRWTVMCRAISQRALAEIIIVNTCLPRPFLTRNASTERERERRLFHDTPDNSARSFAQSILPLELALWTRGKSRCNTALTYGSAL